MEKKIPTFERERNEVKEIHIPKSRIYYRKSKFNDNDSEEVIEVESNTPKEALELYKKVKADAEHRK